MEEKIATPSAKEIIKEEMVKIETIQGSMKENQEEKEQESNDVPSTQRNIEFFTTDLRSTSKLSIDQSTKIQVSSTSQISPRTIQTSVPKEIETPFLLPISLGTFINKFASKNSEILFQPIEFRLDERQEAAKKLKDILSKEPEKISKKPSKKHRGKYQPRGPKEIPINPDDEILELYDADGDVELNTVQPEQGTSAMIDACIVVNLLKEKSTDGVIQSKNLLSSKLKMKANIQKGLDMTAANLLQVESSNVEDSRSNFIMAINDLTKIFDDLSQLNDKEFSTGLKLNNIMNVLKSKTQKLERKRRLWRRLLNEKLEENFSLMTLDLGMSTLNNPLEPNQRKGLHEMFNNFILFTTRVLFKYADINHYEIVVLCRECWTILFFRTKQLESKLYQIQNFINLKEIFPEHVSRSHLEELGDDHYELFLEFIDKVPQQITAVNTDLVPSLVLIRERSTRSHFCVSPSPQMLLVEQRYNEERMKLRSSKLVATKNTQDLNRETFSSQDEAEDQDQNSVENENEENQEIKETILGKRNRLSPLYDSLELSKPFNAVDFQKQSDTIEEGTNLEETKKLRISDDLTSKEIDKTKNSIRPEESNENCFEFSSKLHDSIKPELSLIKSNPNNRVAFSTQGLSNMGCILELKDKTIPPIFFHFDDIKNINIQLYSAMMKQHRKWAEIKAKNTDN